MTLPAPFNGPQFDADFSSAVDQVTSDFITSLPATPSTADRDMYRQGVNGVMQNALNDVAFNGERSYTFGEDNSHLVNRVAGECGLGETFTETILQIVYTDSALGTISNFYGNPAQSVATYKSTADQSKALTPTVGDTISGGITKIVSTVTKPLTDAIGITGSQAVAIGTVIVIIAALVALAYVYRSVK